LGVQEASFFTSVSSNGLSNAIIWAVGHPTDSNPANVTLYAYGPQAAAQGKNSWLFSAVAGTWPNVNGNANIVPVVANGRVYVASYKELRIFGLAPGSATVTITSPANGATVTDPVTVTAYVDSTTCNSGFNRLQVLVNGKNLYNSGGHCSFSAAIAMPQGSDTGDVQAIRWGGALMGQSPVSVPVPPGGAARPRRVAPSPRRGA